MIAAGSVGTFCSQITLPASSTTHTDVSFTDTSRSTKCAISPLLPRCSRSHRLGIGVARIGLEAGPLSQWLHAGLVAAEFEVVLLETRHVKAALSAMVTARMRVAS